MTGATIVVVTHNPEIAELTDRTVTVRDGEIVSDSATKPAKPKTPAPAPAAHRRRVLL